ncbi:MAG: NYN domain-containing protein, partial [Acidimicrobiales bacterium]
YEAREKGIDVLIALHMVMGAVRDDYDVAVLASGDSDLVPAVEMVLDLGKRCEVAAGRAMQAGTPASRCQRLAGTCGATG